MAPQVPPSARSHEEIRPPDADGSRIRFLLFLVFKFFNYPYEAKILWPIDWPFRLLYANSCSTISAIITRLGGND